MTAPTPSEPRTVAAVDLGSNSFHMIIARSDGGPPEILDRLRERVQIAAGLDEAGNLSERAKERAFACLERFGQRLRDFSSDRVRAVGTNTFRRTRRSRSFRIQAERALGHRIEIVSGGEEARLVHLGVTRSQIVPESRHLLIDVGGGSTELIVGNGETIVAAESVPLGCVSYSLRFFPEGRITEKAYRNAVMAARIELRPITERLRELGWEAAFGSAGTAHAIQRLVRATGDPHEAVTRPGLRRLRLAIQEAGHIDRIDLPDLSDDRRSVLPGGLAVTHAIFKQLKIAALTAAPGGLREGILHDLLGRRGHGDIREATIRRFLDRYEVDPDQGTRVEKTALALFEASAEPWGLDEAAAERLSWAARLHEIGLAISHQGYHKHGEYMIRHSDMPGFSTDDQEVIATLVRSHRRRPPRKRLVGLPHVGAEEALRLCVLLRLAVVLHRDRRDGPPAPFEPCGDSEGLELCFPAGYFAHHPLTAEELERERRLAEDLGVKISIGETDRAGGAAEESDRETGSARREDAD